MSKLLVVDDEQSICWGLSQFGKQLGHTVVAASSAEQALEIVGDEPPAAILVDVRLPGMSGLTAIGHFRERFGDIPIIVMTAYGDLDTAVEAVRRSAFEYIVKPFGIEQIESILTRALTSQAVAPNSDHHADQVVVGGLIGRSRPMQEVFSRIALAAASAANVLVSGESGTGKELVARAIHQFSPRESGPFVAVNVAALAPSLAESELFGHVRGAFTGAETTRPGLLEQAHAGTLFLDEVADIPLSTQVKLLRAIEQGEVTPVGGNRTVPTDFRIVSASHQSLISKVQQGLFRHDLYFRLCAFQIELPPLRARGDDISELAQFFIARLCDGADKQPPASSEFLAELRSRRWPGNVRELRNAIEHALIVARDGPLLAEHLPPAIATNWLNGAAGGAVDQIDELVQRWSTERLGQIGDEAALLDELAAIIEPPLFRAAMKASGNQVATAARKLGMHRTTLKKKLEQYGIEDAT
ncbi:MAG: sigma-54 dependent transcriptional regulator [Pirellulales bacterium]